MVGPTNMFCCAPTEDNAVYGDDLEGRFLRVGEEVVHKATDVTVGVLGPTGRGAERPRLTLVGALFDPKARRKRRPERVGIAAGGLRSSDVVMPGETVEVKTTTYARVRYGRLAVDAHERWNLERVRVCAFAGDARDEMATLREVPVESCPLAARASALPVFLTSPGEWVALTFRNCGPAPIALRGRLIGEGTWGRDEVES